RGIIGGYLCGGEGEPCGVLNLPYFRPNANATRGQISKIVANAAGYSDPQTGQTFEDVPPGNVFHAWIERLASRGIMGGYSCGGAGEPCGTANLPYFRPNANATRGQISKIVANTFYSGCVTTASPK
ncbi:MAG TPA: S-layer homology domain-containing protein, partial [Chloroflexia bacterium]|nr:S-layer homology domain-containing protein [Chloroflexia bacterium]